VIMIVFTMMAIGLNMVVGYAGLLDLGYVAFYAAGAYTAAWFASQQFDQWTFHFGSVGISKELPGIHLSIWLVLAIAGCFTALIGILIGLPTLRLRGDYLAIVTLGFGEIIPQVVRNGDNVFGFDLTHGTFGISPIDSPGFGEVGESLGLPLSYQQSFDRAQWFYWTALVLLLITVFCSVQLRDSRLGRAWRRRRGPTRSALSSAASRAPSTPASRAARSPPTSTSTSRSSCSAWSSSAGWGRSGACCSAG
jgi:branched-chain amino acid transport system permease protein